MDNMRGFITPAVFIAVTILALGASVGAVLYKSDTTESVGGNPFVFTEDQVGTNVTDGYVLQASSTSVYPQWVATSSLGIVGSGSGASALNDLNDVTLTSTSTGDILYNNSSGQFVNLAAGSDGQVLKLASGIPSWGTDNTGAGGGGGISTTTPWTTGNLAYVVNDSTVSSVATGTLTTTAPGLEFDATRSLVGGAAILSLTSGYSIPLTASTTNWNTFYDTPSNRITAGTGLSWSTNTLNAEVQTSDLHDAVTLAGSLDYLTLSGQQITRNAIDLTTDTTGTLSVASGGTGATTLTGILLGNGTSAFTASSSLADSYLDDNLTISSLGSVAWSALTSYPTGCTNQFVTTIADTLTCASVTSASITDGAITNDDINASAAIAYSKLNLAGSIAETDLNANAPTDDYVLTASSTASGGFAWAANASSSEWTDAGNYLYSNEDTDRVYVGTTTDSSILNKGHLAIASSTSQLLLVDSDDNFASRRGATIGYNTGSIRFNNAFYGTTFAQYGCDDCSVDDVWIGYLTGADNVDIQAVTTGSDAGMTFTPFGTGDFIFNTDADSYLGIGTTTPASVLDVTGSVRFESLGGGLLSTAANGVLSATTTSGLKSTLALNNVENTALSTWAGSTNLTTLGTIGTGVWQGTAIADTYIADTLTIGSASSIAAGAYSAASIDGDDINSNIAGRSITLTAGSPDILDLDAEIYTESMTFNYASSTIGTTTKPVLVKKVPTAITISTITCFDLQTGTSTIQLEERTSPFSAGTDILGAGGILAPYNNAISSSTLPNSGIASGSYIAMIIDGFFEGTPTNPVCDIAYTIND